MRKLDAKKLPRDIKSECKLYPGDERLLLPCGIKVFYFAAAAAHRGRGFYGYGYRSDGSDIAPFLA